VNEFYLDVIVWSFQDLLKPLFIAVLYHLVQVMCL